MPQEHCESECGLTRGLADDVTTYPPVGCRVIAKLKHCSSGHVVVEELIRVDESDATWRTAAGRSELSFDWDVVSWRLASPPV